MWLKRAMYSGVVASFLILPQAPLIAGDEPEPPKVVCCQTPNLRVGNTIKTDRGCYVLAYIYSSGGGVNYWYAMPCPSGGNAITVVSTYNGPSLSCSQCMASCVPPGCQQISTRDDRPDADPMLVKVGTNVADVYQLAVGHGFDGELTSSKTATITTGIDEKMGQKIVNQKHFVLELNAKMGNLFLDVRMFNLPARVVSGISSDGTKVDIECPAATMMVGWQITGEGVTQKIPVGNSAYIPMKGFARRLGLCTYDGTSFPVVLHKSAEPDLN